MLLNLTPTDAREARGHRGDPRTSHTPGAIYRDERAAFYSLGVPPPREIPFDLIAQATLMLLPLLLGVSLADRATSRASRGADDHGWTFNLARRDGLAVPRRPARAAGPPAGHLASARARRRRRHAAAAASPARSSAARAAASARSSSTACSASWPRSSCCSRSWRWRATATSWRRCGGSSASRSRSPRVTIPFMLRKGERAGQTLGKQLFGLRVVCDDHGVVTRGGARPRASCS